MNKNELTVIENKILDSLDLDTLKELIGTNSSSSDDGWNSGGVSDSNRGDPYVPPARDDQSIVTPDYIVNYNLYDLQSDFNKNSWIDSNHWQLDLNNPSSSSSTFK